MTTPESDVSTPDPDPEPAPGWRFTTTDDEDAELGELVLAPLRWCVSKRVHPGHALEGMAGVLALLIATATDDEARQRMVRMRVAQSMLDDDVFESAIAALPPEPAAPTPSEPEAA